MDHTFARCTVESFDSQSACLFRFLGVASGNRLIGLLNVGSGTAAKNAISIPSFLVLAISLDRRSDIGQSLPPLLSIQQRRIVQQDPSFVKNQAKVEYAPMDQETLSEHRSGYVALLGKPNVGKSTLVNALIGQKIAAVTSKAQTTRRRQLGILSTDAYQAIFTDTPGLHQERTKLGRLMNEDALKALEDADIVWLILDISQAIDEDDRHLINTLKSTAKKVPLWALLNKQDIADASAEKQVRQRLAESLPEVPIYSISAREQAGLDILKSDLSAALPLGPPFYDPEQITDLYERQIAADLIRESALNLLRDEVPHGIAVRIDEYIERGESGARINATLFVEKESHRGIVLGRKGSQIKAIGTQARKEIERMSGRKIYLELRVKLRKNWRNDEAVLNRFGY